MEPNEIEKASEEYGEDKGEWITNVHQYFTGDGIREGFIAGVEWAKQQEGEGLRWVKASERLPPVKVPVVIKDKDGVYVAEAGSWDKNVTDYEWLEEPTP